jgi:hypothetical protein
MTPHARQLLVRLCVLAALVYLVVMVVTGARPRQAQFVAFEAAGVLTREPDEVSKVRITAAGQAWELIRRGEGWATTDAVLPAAVAEQLALALRILHTARPVRVLRGGDLGSRAADYGLDRPTHAVEVSVDDQSPLQLAFGGTTPDGALRYMRIEGRPAVYLVSNFVPDEWQLLVDALRAGAAVTPGSPIP